MVGDTYLFSPTLVNQFRASVDRIAVHRYADNYVSACDLGVPVYCGYVPHQSGFTVTGAFSVGPGTGGQAKAHSTPLQLNDDISWVHGNHQINFGGGGEVSKMLFYGNVYSQTNWTFNNIPAFLLGEFSTNSMSLPNDLLQEKWFMNFYVQDTWKVTSHFTVNVGLRWEPFFPPSEINGSVYNFSLAESDRRNEEHAICERASRPQLSRAIPASSARRANKSSGICLRLAWRWLGTPRATAKWSSAPAGESLTTTWPAS